MFYKLSFIILFLFSFFSDNSLVAQNSSTKEIVRLQDFYEGVGVVFLKEYSPYVQSKMNVNKTRFSPSLNDIIKSEEIFLDQYVQAISNEERYSYLLPTHAKEYFWKWNRQYIGYINSDNEKEIDITVLNFAQEGSAEKFEGWMEELEFSSGDFYSKNVKKVKINLDSGNLILF